MDARLRGHDAVVCFFVLMAFFFSTASHAEPTHAIALHGTPKYAADFTHFDYINSDAPKGGELRMSALGTFDTLNPFTLKGVNAADVGSVFETLMVKSLDEPFTEYGWVAESVAVAADRGSVSFTLRPQAKFHDGSPITSDDVIFSFEILRDKGHPFYRSYYKDVVKAEKIGAHGVRFVFRDNTNTELPLILGELPIMQKRYWQGKDFAATTLDAIMGSGPYELDSFTPGRTISYKRVKNWWAADLPINRGRFNFDKITYDYYRDSTVALEAFFAGRYDFRAENVAKNWALAYKTPAVQSGQIKKEEIKNGLPSGMQGFIFNTRRDMFNDRRVREALNYAFDFEWSNKNMAYGAYTRTQSYFANSELAATGLPSADELKILEPLRGKIPDEIFAKEFKLPTTDGSGDNRDNLRKAAELLDQAGWTLKDGKRVNAQGQALTFEIIDAEPVFERWVQPFVANLKRLGITANFRIVDTAQLQRRIDDFDFDITIGTFPASLSPGNEEFDMWSSTKADVKGSRNLIGVHDPAVDTLVQNLLHAKTREDLVTACHALDRVLSWQYYVIPHWHIGTYRIGYWDMFGRPAVNPPYGLPITDAWWVDATKAQKIMGAQKRNR
jgi:microcin C transport system substrate-binding protein